MMNSLAVARNKIHEEVFSNIMDSRRVKSVIRTGRALSKLNYTQISSTAYFSLIKVNNSKTDTAVAVCYRRLSYFNTFANKIYIILGYEGFHCVGPITERRTNSNKI